jgi:photosystem II stability/assembly factor-like uncharacterized protein
MDGRTALIAGWLLVSLGPFVIAQPPDLQRSWRDDAALHDVQFVSTRTGWSVGEHGTLWQTTDGGATWTLRETGTSATFRSVCLLTDEVGWIAGWQVRGSADLTAGVLLATRDGGTTWETLDTASLSPLRYVRFFGLDEGVVLGEPTPENVTGAWSTSDGGKSWQTLEGRPVRGWTAAALFAPDRGVLADRDGNVALLAGPQLLPSRLPPLKGRSPRAAALSADDHGWIVGEGGLVMHSPSGGAAWQPPEVPLPEETRHLCDFRTVAVKDGAVWIAGNPGGVVWHSPNAGARWIKQPTSVTTPINKVHFLSARHGCAVGELGVILMTGDGGETWTTVRGRGRHAALLSIHARPEAISPEVVAKVAGEQGYRSAAVIAVRLPEPRGPLSLSDRVREAVCQSGGSAAEVSWPLPLDVPGLELDSDKLVEHWQRKSDGQLSQTLLGHLVRQIRAWRPHVVIVDQPPPDDAAAQLTFNATLHAVEQAGDGTRFVSQRELGGLAPWKVERIYLRLLAGNTGEISLDPFEVLPRWRANGRSAATISKALLAAETSKAVRPSFRAIDRQGQPAPQSQGLDFFAGLSLPPGGEVRRQVTPFDDRHLDQAIKAAQRQRNFASYAERTLDDPRIAGQMIAQLRDVTTDMTAQQGAATLFDLFQEYRRRSQLDLAEAAAMELLKRYPDEPLSADAARWLLPYFVSAEVAWQDVRQARSPARSRPEGLKIPRKYAVRQISYESQALHLPELKERQAKALQVVRYVEERWPLLAGAPDVQFPLAALSRARGAHAQADAVYRRRLGRLEETSPGDWSDVVRREIWLSQQATEVPDGVARCFAASTKPVLDGILSDECWHEAREWTLAHRVPATMPDGPPPLVMLAYDDEYLYIAASVPRIDGQSTDPVQREGRRHDADLRRHDRLAFCFDIDRDYATWYAFEVDQRGWTTDSCWENPGYNPQWYVAADGDEAHWRTEIAIPWSELTPKRPQAGATWSLGLVRTAPAAGTQHWSRPSPPDSGKPSLGLLRFE